MIKGLGITTVWTFDQERTKAFFTEKLDFEVHDDLAMGDMRWITVGAKDQPDVELALMSLDGPGLDPESAEALKKLVSKGALGAACSVRTTAARTTRRSRRGALSSSRNRRSGRTASRRSSATTTATGTHSPSAARNSTSRRTSTARPELPKATDPEGD